VKPSPRLFSLDEANALLPALNSFFDRWSEKREVYTRRHDELLMHELLREAERHAAEAGPQTLEAEIQAVEEALADLAREIETVKALGCVVRNLERGWVDFLAKRDTERIYFCWHRGEKAIRFYHSLAAGMTERLPLD